MPHPGCRVRWQILPHFYLREVSHSIRQLLQEGDVVATDVTKIIVYIREYWPAGNSYIIDKHKAT